ncbi:MAG: hypothetical protein IBX55_08900 [Methyloprofundus sp.]|nr:hypothetical protein [Methyloprofundus sp.]
MTKITRFAGDVKAFASQASVNKRTTFGTLVTGDDSLTGNITPEYLEGWEIVGVNDSPTLEDFNALGFTATQFNAYLHQIGVPEWHGAQKYEVGSIVNRTGDLYRCKTANFSGVTAPENDNINWALITPAIATTAQAQAGTDNTTLLTPLKLREGLNAPGSAPLYACRAWVNFNGTGTVAIRASGNVSSITDLGVGRYRVNFATAMIDADYAVIVGTGGTSEANGHYQQISTPISTTSCYAGSRNTNTVADFDPPNVSVNVFK